MKIYSAVEIITSEFHALAGSPGGVMSWISSKWSAYWKTWKAPQVAVEAISIRDGRLSAFIAGEDVPRRFESVDVSVRLADNYSKLAVDITGEPSLDSDSLRPKI